MADKASVDCTSSSQVTGESSESTIEINIKTLDSQIYTFRVNKDRPVSMLKEKIVTATGVPLEQQRLIFRGKVLKDDDLLSAYHLEDGHTLHLVARQPVQVAAQHTPGIGSEDARNSGNDSTGAPRSRIGQVSHSVVLGTVNVADQGEGMVADIGRLVGAVLNSFGVGNLAPNGGASITTSSVTPNQAPPSAETERTQNATGGTQPGNSAQAGFPFQPPQISQIPRLITIPDSLTTLSEFISRMELALPHDGSQQSPPTNVQDPPRSGVPSLNSRGLPTPEVLGAVLERVQQFLTGNAAAALSHIAGRLGREIASADPVVRGHIQSEAMHVGVVMQHLGAMLLELGRTMMTLRMGQSPAVALVNAGPAVYISPTGPNPIMVQPFPLQPSSLFGIPSPSLFSALQGPFGAGDPSRNINIHIHAGAPGAPGAQSVGTRANLGEAIRGERPNVEQLSINGNVSGGLPSRTVVTAIPARSAAETASNVLSVMYPVHVRSQLSVPLHSASAQASHPTSSVAAQPNAPGPVRQPSSESDTTSTLVAQLNSHIASVLAGNTQGQPAVPATQPNAPIPAPQPSTVSDSTSALVANLNAYMAHVLAGNTQGQTRPSGTQPNTASQFPQDQSSSPSVPPGGLHISNNAGSQESSVIEESSTTKSVDCPAVGQASDTLSSKQVIESSQRNLDSVSTEHTSRSNLGSVSAMPAPLGLGAGGLQPKRRGKPAKPTGKDDVSHGTTSSTNQNQQSIARGQQVLQSLLSQTSDSGGVLPGLGRGHGGVDILGMIQQVMPVVSQAFGRGSAWSTSVPGVQSQRPQSRDVIIGENGLSDDINTQINVQPAVERIEQLDSPENVFRAMLECASLLHGEEGSVEDLVEFYRDNPLTDLFVEMIRRSMHERLQSESRAKDES